MTYMYEGKRISESELSTVIYKQMTDEDLENYLNLEYDPVEILWTEYECGTALMRVDMEMFKEIKPEICELIALSIMKDPEEGAPYGITWEEDDE